MADYQLYLFKNLTQQEINFLDAVKAKGVELDNQMNTLEQSGICDATWLAWGRKFISLGVNCIVRSISKQGGF